MARSKKKVVNQSKPASISASDSWARKTITISLSAERRALLRSVLPEDEHGLLSPSDVIYHLIDLIGSDDPEVKLPAPQSITDERLDRLERDTRQNSEALALCAESLRQIAASMASLHTPKLDPSPPASKPVSTWMARVLTILEATSMAEISLGLKLVSMVPGDDGMVSISFNVGRLQGPAVSLPPLRLKPMPATSALAVCLQGQPTPALILTCKKEVNGWRATIRKPHSGGASLLELLL
jgi:hypothetical protein